MVCTQSDVPPASPDPLDLACAAIRQASGFRNAVATSPENDHTVMQGLIRAATAILALLLGELDALLLAGPTIFIVLAGHLQGDLEQHVLDGFEHDLRHVLGAGCNLGQINDAGHGERCPLVADGGHEFSRPPKAGD